MDPAELERALHERLQHLPGPRAPRTLAPRVMAAVRARAALPWYRRAWVTWPVWARGVAALVALVAAVAGTLWLPGAIEVAADQTSQAASAALVEASSLPWPPSALLRDIGEAAGAARVLWRTVMGPVVFYASSFAVVMGMVLAACAAALARLTSGRALSS